MRYRVFSGNIRADIEKESGKDYLRIILPEGKAISNYADAIGLFIGAIWRKDNIGLVEKQMEQYPETRRSEVVAAYPDGAISRISGSRVRRYVEAYGLQFIRLR